MNPISWVAVKSCFSPRYFTFSQILPQIPDAKITLQDSFVKPDLTSLFSGCKIQVALFCSYASAIWCPFKMSVTRISGTQQVSDCNMEFWRYIKQCFLTQFPLQCFVKFYILKVVFVMCQVPIVCLTLDLAGFGQFGLTAYSRQTDLGKLNSWLYSSFHC